MPENEISSRAPIESETLPAPIESESSSLMAVIERAARDPAVDVDKLERLLAMHDKIASQRARASYFAALAQMQSKLPIIEERGQLIIREKETKRILQTTPYAKWEDINEVILPILGQHGFALSFRTGLAADGRLLVTGILSHAEGHSEETTMTLPHDSTGSKNAVQAIGSTTSYGKRYAAAALLNLNSRAPEDRDTDASSSHEPISPAQVDQLQQLIVETGVDIQKFLDFMRVMRLEEIIQDEFERGRRALEQKKKLNANQGDKT